MVTNKAMSILFLFYMDINLLYVPELSVWCLLVFGFMLIL